MIHYEPYTEELDCINAQEEVIQKVKRGEGTEKLIGYKAVELTFTVEVSKQIEEVTCEECLKLYTMNSNTKH